MTGPQRLVAILAALVVIALLRNLLPQAEEPTLQSGAGLRAHGGPDGLAEAEALGLADGERDELLDRIDRLKKALAETEANCEPRNQPDWDRTPPTLPPTLPPTPQPTPQLTASKSVEPAAATGTNCDDGSTGAEKEAPRSVPFVPRPTSKRETLVDLAADQFPDVLRMQNDLAEFDILIVGAGLSGTVLADMYARKHGKKVLILERRPHIGGNCFDFRESQTDILVNLYGAHLFHTNKDDVWRYVHRFSRWTPYEHRVTGRVDGKLVPIPVNIDTVNLLLGEDLRSVSEMEEWIKAERQASPVGEVDVSDAKDSREVGMGRVGERLYNKLFREYTKKQWNVYPEELSPVVLSRIPVRNDYDDRYFPNDVHQALPADGYTQWFEQALDHPNIKVFTSTDYFDAMKRVSFRNHKFERTFFTGQIDQFFRNKGSELKPLQYRSIKFETVVLEEPSVYQPAFVVNFPQFRDGNHTRAAEYKHMYHQNSAASVIIREYSTDIVDDAEPYYPFPTAENQRHFEQYQELAKEEEVANKVHFVGRLANYKYFNMDDAIKNALELYVRLEGTSLLDEALAEGEKRIPRTDALGVHYVVSLPATGHARDLDLSWLAGLCSLSELDGVAVEPKFFVYNMNRRLDWVFEEKLADVAGCQELVEGRTLFVRNVAPGPVELSWLEYFSQHSFGFGDSNVFIDASATKADLKAIEAGLRIQVSRLFSRKMTQASQAEVVKADIRTLDSLSLDGKSWPVSSLSALLDSGDLMFNLAHAFPLDRKGLRPSGSTGARRGTGVLSELPKSCPQMSTRLFVATDAAIRRMLSVHRTNIYDSLIPELRKEPSGERFARDLQSVWFCLFFRPVR